MSATSFCQAVADGEVETVRALLARGEDPNKKEYLRTVGEAGGFKAYEKAHTRALVAMLARKFPGRIPEEIFPRVVAFWAHAGFYASAAAVAALPRAS